MTQLGGWSVDVEIINAIKELIPQGSTIVELGSGHGSTSVLPSMYTLYSIEHNKKFIGLYNSNYIHAPLVNDFWYDRNIVTTNLPDTYDLLLVDGPIAHRRRGFIDNYDLFDHNVPIILDDTNRPVEQQMLKDLVAKFNKKILTRKRTTSNKEFAVIMPA